jgi:tetratricopeptide (TPR) repeat protein
LQLNKGVSFIKDSNLRLAWVALLKGNDEAYRAFVGKVKSAGYTFQDKDQQALNEVDDAVPNKLLLKARLLFDGGYYTKALDLLSRSDENNFSVGRDRTEFFYRLGRILDEIGKGEEAVGKYERAIKAGKSLKYYFAANSALQAGKILERKKDLSKAKAFFDLAIQMKDHDYEGSIETQAKAGLKRIGI